MESGIGTTQAISLLAPPPSQRKLLPVIIPLGPIATIQTGCPRQIVGILFHIPSPTHRSTAAGLPGAQLIQPADIPVPKLVLAPIQLHNTEELLVLVHRRKHTQMHNVYQLLLVLFRQVLWSMVAI